VERVLINNIRNSKPDLSKMVEQLSELNQNQVLSEEEEAEEEVEEEEPEAASISGPKFKLYCESKGENTKALMEVLLK